MQTTKVTLSGKEYSIFEVTAFEGTPRQQQIPVAECALESLIEELIEKNGYTKEVANIDTSFAYALSQDVDMTNEDEIRRYVEQLLDDDLDPLD